jgi:hypothetical protein
VNNNLLLKVVLADQLLIGIHDSTPSLVSQAAREEPFIILYFYNQELYFDLNKIIKLFTTFFNSFFMYLVAIEKEF